MVALTDMKLIDIPIEVSMYHYYLWKERQALIQEESIRRYTTGTTTSSSQTLLRRSGGGAVSEDDANDDDDKNDTNKNKKKKDSKSSLSTLHSIKYRRIVTTIAEQFPHLASTFSNTYTTTLKTGTAATTITATSSAATTKILPEVYRRYIAFPQLQKELQHASSHTFNPTTAPSIIPSSGNPNVPTTTKSNTKVVDSSVKLLTKLLTLPKSITDPNNTSLKSSNKKQKELTFNERIEQLLEYKRKYRHCRVSTEQDYDLSIWCYKIRQSYTRCVKDPFLLQNPYPSTSYDVTIERIQKLNQIGFEWFVLLKPYNVPLTFQENYNHLIVYKKSFGHCRVTDKYDYNLATWVDTIRDNYHEQLSRPNHHRIVYSEQELASNNTLLSPERLHLLNEIDFEWDQPKNRKNNTAAAAGKKTPTTAKKRRSKKKGTDDADKKDDDDDAKTTKTKRGRPSAKKGKAEDDDSDPDDDDDMEDDDEEEFDADGNPIKTKGKKKKQSWGGTTGSFSYERWNQRFQELLDYYKEHGDEAFYPNKNPALGGWVHKQRMYFRKHTLSQDRIAKLNSIGFIWELPPGTAGADGTDPNTSTTDAGATPSSSSRLSKGTGRSKVSHLGLWEDRIEQCRIYLRTHGHLNIPPVLATMIIPEDDDADDTNYNFYDDTVPIVEQLSFRIWAQDQRHEYRKIKYEGKIESWLTASMIKQLDELGFVWDPIETSAKGGTTTFHQASYKERKKLLLKLTSDELFRYRAEQIKITRTVFDGKFSKMYLKKAFPEDADQIEIWCRLQRKLYRDWKNSNFTNTAYTKEKQSILEKIGFDLQPSAGTNAASGNTPGNNDSKSKKRPLSNNNDEDISEETSGAGGGTTTKKVTKKEEDGDQKEGGDSSAKTETPKEEPSEGTKKKSPTKAKNEPTTNEDNTNDGGRNEQDFM